MSSHVGKHKVRHAEELSSPSLTENARRRFSGIEAPPPAVATSLSINLARDDPISSRSIRSFPLCGDTRVTAGADAYRTRRWLSVVFM